MVSIKNIQSFINASGVKSILQTKPQAIKNSNPKVLKLFGKLEGDVVTLSKRPLEQTSFEMFSENWKDVLKSTKNALMEPSYNKTLKGYSKFSEPEKCIAAYCDDDFSTATNLFLRYGKKHPEFEWYADQGLTSEIILKYKQALKYALENTTGITTYQGNTFRWQMGGTFQSRFKDVKVGDIITENSFMSTSSNIAAADSFRVKLNRAHLYEQMPEPELIVIKGKKGKILPEKLPGFRSYENEVLYNADTKYKFVGKKTVSNPQELGLEEHVQYLKNGNNPFSDFIECNVIYLEEL